MILKTAANPAMASAKALAGRWIKPSLPVCWDAVDWVADADTFVTADSVCDVEIAGVYAVVLFHVDVPSTYDGADWAVVDSQVVLLNIFGVGEDVLHIVAGPSEVVLQLLVYVSLILV